MNENKKPQDNVEVPLSELEKKKSEIEEAEKAIKVEVRLRSNIRAGRRSEKEWTE